LTDAESTPSGGLFETASDQEAMARAAAAAAPAAVERADLAQVHTLEPGLREPVFALLSSLADNKYVLGRRYAEWCTGAPMLESAVAAAAMAQDELGHARSFYPLLRGFASGGASATAMEEKGWQTRPTSAMSCLDQRFGTWADFVAANLLVDTALTTLFAAAVDSPYEPLRQRARKIQQEETGHWVHAAGWVRRLPKQALAGAMSAMWDDAFTWFGEADDPVVSALAAARVVSDGPEALRARLRGRLEPVLDEAGLDALFDRPLPWRSWEPRARRLQNQ
jgi:phenylacetate-CoA oxygenase PaaI subunit